MNFSLTSGCLSWKFEAPSIASKSCPGHSNCVSGQSVCRCGATVMKFPSVEVSLDALSSAHLSCPLDVGGSDEDLWDAAPSEGKRDCALSD